jgi:hypothetical protein
MKKQKVSPMVQYNQKLWINGLNDSKEMNKYCSPYAQFKIVHQIHNEHEKKLETERRQSVRKRVLYPRLAWTRWTVLGTYCS